MDNVNTVAAALMELSKAGESIPHDLVVAKLHSHALGILIPTV